MWVETYLGLTFQIYGLVFFILGVATFGILHGLKVRQVLRSRRLVIASGSVFITGVC